MSDVSECKRNGSANVCRVGEVVLPSTPASTLASEDRSTARTRNLTQRYTEREYAEVLDRAAKYKITSTQFVRKLVLCELEDNAVMSEQQWVLEEARAKFTEEMERLMDKTVDRIRAICAEANALSTKS